MSIRFACPHCQASITAEGRKAGARVNCPKCGLLFEVPIPKGEMMSPTPASPAIQAQPAQAPDPFGFDSHREDADARRSIRREGDGTDAPGVISLIFGCLSLACILLGFFTCGATFFGSLPFALIGFIVGFFGRGNFRVAGVVLNSLALLPAVIAILCVLGFIGISSIGALAKPTAKTSVQSSPVTSEWPEVSQVPPVTRPFQNLPPVTQRPTPPKGPKKTPERNPEPAKEPELTPEQKAALAAEEAAKKEAEAVEKKKAEEEAKKRADEEVSRKAEAAAKKRVLQDEDDAGRKLKLTRMYYVDGKRVMALERLREIIRDYPKTQAAAQARKFLEEW